VELDRFFDDGQPQTGSGDPAYIRRAVECLKEACLIGLRDADPLVSDDNSSLIAMAGEVEGNRAVGRWVFDSGSSSSFKAARILAHGCRVIPSGDVIDMPNLGVLGADKGHVIIALRVNGMKL
jgi:hypothetical protein